MDLNYIRKKLEIAGAEESVIEEAMYFASNRGWRKDRYDENYYVIGLAKYSNAYYWICYKDMHCSSEAELFGVDTKYVVMVEVKTNGKNFQHSLVKDKERELSEQDIRNIRNQLNGRDYLVLFNEELYYDYSYNDYKALDDLCDTKTDSPVKEEPCISEAVNVSKQKSTDGLYDSMEKELLDYAMNKLSDTAPLEIRLTQLETFRYNAFIEKHRCCIGGVALKMHPTSLGWCFECECLNCGKKEDITDTGSW